MTVITDVEAEAKKILTGAEADAVAFAHATGDELVKLYEEVLGSDGYKSFVATAESLLKQEAGQIIKSACALAAAALKDGPAAALKALASAFSLSALKTAGISVGEALLNLAIELVINGGKVAAVAAVAG